MSLLPREAPGEDKNLILSETISSKLLGFTFKSFLFKDFSTVCTNRLCIRNFLSSQYFIIYLERHSMICCPSEFL
jgi:hypothetical protein